MDAAEEYAGGKSVWDVLFGLQLGIMGGVLMLAWFAVASPVIGQPWWLVPNLFASYFYASRDIYVGPGIVTLVGIALQIVSSGVVGCVSGVTSPGGRLSGLAAALLWYLVCSLYLWKRIAPAVLSPAIQPLLWTGYFVFGSTLGWHRHLVRARRANLAD